MIDVTALADQVLQAPFTGRRRLIALAGPPASGKSTVAEALATAVCATDSAAQVVPMDGFHLDNRVLRKRGLLDRKGAPETFDAEGFVHLVQRLKAEDQVIYPLFDRAGDLAIAGAGEVGPACETVIVEGNYLLFVDTPWRDLRPLWDIAIALDVPEDVLRQRLIDRWSAHGLSEAEAMERAEGNDLRNARLVKAHALKADVTISNHRAK